MRGFHRVNPETFSTRDDQGTWITFGFDNLLLASELKLMGHHNISNGWLLWHWAMPLVCPWM